MAKVSVRSSVSRGPTGAVLCIVLIGLVAAWVGSRLAAGYEAQRASSEFEACLSADAYALETRLWSIVETLNSLRALFDSSEEVTRDEFKTFTRAIPSRLPSIQALEWVPRVRQAEREFHERKVHSEGLVDYRIRDRLPSGEMVPSPLRAEYFPVSFAEPREGNAGALGFDLGSESVRRLAVDQAMNSGGLALTQPLALVQEEESSPSILGLLPVHGGDGGATQRSPEHVQGFVVAVCRVEDILREARLEPGTRRDGLYLALIDLDPDGTRHVLYGAPKAGAAAAPAGFLSERRIQLGGRDWRLLGYPTEAFLSQRLTSYPETLGTVVGLLAFSLGGLIYFLSKRSRELALRTQDQTTRAVLASLSEGVVVSDRAGEILYANEAAERMVGVGAGGTNLGRWSTLFDCYLPDAQTPCPEEDSPWARAIRGERVLEQDMVLRRTGSPAGMSLRASTAPLLDETGSPIGGVVVLRDVTARLESEQLVRLLSNAVEQTADSVFITDVKGRISYVNPAFTETTGYGRVEALGKTPRILRSGEHDREYYSKLWRTILAGEVYRSTVVNRKKSGELFFAEQTITPMKGAAGVVTEFISVAKDMTEGRRIHEQEIEMRLAAEVQQNLYPRELMRVPGFDIAGAVYSAEATCGDYFDILRVGDEAIGIAIGDVSGHGLGPALVMAQTRAYLRSFVRTGWQLGEILEGVNAALVDDLRNRMFVTLLFACIDLPTRRLVYASAGHTPCYVLDARGDIKHVLAGTGTALGVSPSSAYQQGEEVTLEPGDMLAFFTDGVTETRSHDGRLFEAEGALAVVRAHRHESSKAILDHIHEAIVAFRASPTQPDDITMVVCKLDAASAASG